MNKDILITGGAGFIGRYLSDLYLAKGYNVVIIDNLSTGNIKNINFLKKKYLNTKNKIKFVRSSVKNINY